MTTYIALLRGINVGGKNPLPMKQLTVVFEELGAENVKTYIQSGNVVFRHSHTDVATLAQEIGAKIKERFGFQPQIFVITLSDLESAMCSNPFPEAESAPDTLHLGFLSSTPQSPDLVKLESLRIAGERFQLIGKIFYLHAPDGVGRSKLASSSERLLGVPMTDRNWNTICKLKLLATAGTITVTAPD
jgi:uncharacterized protein (DUF1697 family)